MWHLSDAFLIFLLHLTSAELTLSPLPPSSPHGKQLAPVRVSHAKSDGTRTASRLTTVCQWTRKGKTETAANRDLHYCLPITQVGPIASGAMCAGSTTFRLQPWQTAENIMFQFIEDYHLFVFGFTSFLLLFTCVANTALYWRASIQEYSGSLLKCYDFEVDSPTYGWNWWLNH